ncbi:MAG: magnesium/cobalt efflux protein [Ponticaulis sp.]|nr:magnesium/cobalt efflux protein [Ponticaulis sp.]
MLTRIRPAKKNKGKFVPVDTADPSPGQSLIGRLTAALSRHSEPEPKTSPDFIQTATPSPAEIRLRIAEFESMRVEDVMIPRAEIIAVEEQTTLADLVRLFADTTHSRLPVYRETLDDPIGVVHIKDLVSVLADRGDGQETDEVKPLNNLRREILYVPPSMRLPDLLLKMQSTRIHLALVVDEYGGTDGIVSLEDLVETIVGEIEDEHDDDVPYITSRGRGIWEVDARAEIPDFEEDSGLDMSLLEFEDDIDTLGGVVFAIAGRVPQRGEIIRHPNGVDMEILDADTRRIRRIRLRCPVESNGKSGNTESGDPEKH